MIEDKDAVSTAKASLELMVMENEHLLNHFSNLLQELEEIEKLPSAEKKERFAGLEANHAFDYQGVDIRMFQNTTKKPLPAKQFLKRTQRRLQNTNNLVAKFITLGEFELGGELKKEIESLTGTLVDDADPGEVKSFRQKVEEVRNSPLFQKYMGLKKKFIATNDEVRTDAAIIAAKETVADNQETLEQRGQDLKEMQDKIESGDLSPEDVMGELANMELITPSE